MKFKNGIIVDDTLTVNQAIRFIKSSPCHICSCYSICTVKYKGTCSIFRKLKTALLTLREVND